MEVGWRAPGTGLKYSNDLWEAGGGEGCDWEEIPEKSARETLSVGDMIGVGGGCHCQLSC